MALRFLWNRFLFLELEGEFLLDIELLLDFVFLGEGCKLRSDVNTGTGERRVVGRKRNMLLYEVSYDFFYDAK